ncbi:MAG TPA: class I SAM-dependent methyltransferase [Acidobacteriota bacterium]|nr:class I SAM-dependent methyltransferase [Acidobacteriota bacterium]
MNRSFSSRRLIAALGFVLISSGFSLYAQQESGYQPHVGQAGKDVVWVPTDEGLVGKMLDMAKVTPQDYVIDLGSGDGRTVIAAAKRGAKAHGIEYNPDMVDLSIRNAAEAGVSDKATFAKADLFESDFSKATVITMFLLPDINLRLRPTLLNLKPGTRVVSNSFTMEDWQADETASMGGNCNTWCTAYLWIVPAKVEGTWRLPDGELTFTQQFQIIKGRLEAGGKSVPLVGKLRGEQVQFAIDDAEYTGRVNGDTITGTVKKASGLSEWSATREK